MSSDLMSCPSARSDAIQKQERKNCQIVNLSTPKRNHSSRFQCRNLVVVYWSSRRRIFNPVSPWDFPTHLPSDKNVTHSGKFPFSPWFYIQLMYTVELDSMMQTVPCCNTKHTSDVLLSLPDGNDKISRRDRRSIWISCRHLKLRPCDVNRVSSTHHPVRWTDDSVISL